MIPIGYKALRHARGLVLEVTRNFRNHQRSIKSIDKSHITSFTMKFTVLLLTAATAIVAQDTVTPSGSSCEPHGDHW
jgi:hypothetical protein